MDLATVQKNASLLVKIAAEIENLENRVDELKAQKDVIAREVLPDLFNQLALSEIKLLDGTKVEVKPWLDCKINKERVQEAYDWLKANGHEAIIRSELFVSRGAVDTATQKEVVAVLKARGIPYGEREDVHAQTLKAWAKVQREQEVILPPCFDVLSGQICQIKKAK